jgi:hypothetical protein
MLLPPLRRRRHFDDFLSFFFLFLQAASSSFRQFFEAFFDTPFIFFISRFRHYFSFFAIILIRLRPLFAAMPAAIAFSSSSPFFAFIFASFRRADIFADYATPLSAPLITPAIDCRHAISLFAAAAMLPPGFRRFRQRFSFA